MRCVLILSFATRTRHNRGVSLVETAIVLGVMGIILAAIWVTVSAVKENIRQDEAARQVTTLVNNVRTFYMGLPSISGDYSGLTDDLIKRGVIPADMVRRPAVAPYKADHPWHFRPSGGGVGVCDDQSGHCSGSETGNGQSFRLRLLSLNPGSCIAMATKFSPRSDPPGLLGVVINGVLHDATHSTWPVTVSAARNDCMLRSADLTQIEYIFRLRQQDP